MSKPKRSSIGVALIARNAEQTLGDCLRSVRPYVEQIVVAVDVTTTDRTRKVAKQAGADKLPDVQVSDWHACPQHGRVLAQHFAQARNHSFSYLDPALDWWMWLDADDVLKGAEHLPKVLEQAKESGSVGIWSPYHYATMLGGSVTNTLFDRERILSTKVGWEWEHRVHEVVAPRGVQDPHWLRSEMPAVYHQEGVHKSASSAERNLLLLEIDLEENPEDARATFYMGNQFFAMGQWAEAAFWYERLCGGMGKNPYELWQSYVYMSMAYEKLGDLDGALKAAMGAVEVRPEHPEPYFRLAAVYTLAGEFDKAEFWTALGRRMQPPPFFVFKNPLDYTFNQRVCLADALAAQGKIGAARAELEQAYSVVPDERIGGAIEKYRRMEDAATKATAYVQLASTQGEEWAVQNGPILPAEVRQFGRARDVYVPLLLARRPSTQPRIVFWCGRSLEEWYPGTLNTTGIGGSETAVVEIARRFAQDGWRVDVYNGAGRHEGIYAGVGYFDPERFSWADAGDGPEVFVSWRQARAVAPMATVARRADSQARVRLLWCHDLNYGPQVTEDMRQWDRILGVSAWHAGMLRSFYTLSDGSVDFVPNGIDPARFDPSIPKMPFRCVYASSPDRGLLRLLHLWPQIIQDEPGAELHIAYGWENVDRSIQMGRQDLAAFKAHVVERLEKTPQVVWRGRLPQNELAQLYGESVAWLYPTDFLEVSCISAMEAMAGGAVPVTSAAGALKETVGKYGAVVPGAVHSKAWQDFYVSVARGVLGDPNIRNPLAMAARQQAEQYTWDAAYARWKGIVEGCLSGQREEVAA